MKILGIEHVAVAVKDFAPGAEFFTAVLGLEHRGEELVKEQKVRTDIYDSGAGKVELLKACEEGSPIDRFLEKRGEGIHHIAFRVEDIEAAIAELMTKGVRMIDEKPRIGAEGLKIAFVHPRSAAGLLIELCEA